MFYVQNENTHIWMLVELTHVRAENGEKENIQKSVWFIES